jgi:hypothetical protein
MIIGAIVIEEIGSINEGAPFAYNYEGLLTQYINCVKQFAATDIPMMNAIIQPAIGDEIDWLDWDDNEMEEFTHQCRVIVAYRETISHHGWIQHVEE